MSLTAAPVVLVAAVLAVLAVVLVPVLWDRVRVAVRAGTVLAAVLLVLAAVGLFVNSRAGFYPDVASLVGSDTAQLPVGENGVVADVGPPPFDLQAAARAHRPGAGVVVRAQLEGGRSGLSRAGAVYLPDAWFTDPSLRFPVVEVLSGSPGSPGQLLQELRLAQVADAETAAHRMAPTVLVVPDTNGSRLRDLECADVDHGPADETYLVRDVADDLLRTGRVLPPGPGWGLLGTSTGGYCALDLLLRAPERYGAAASLSGYVHALTDVTTGPLFRDAQDRREHDPVWRLTHLPRPDRPVLMTAGTAEPQEHAALDTLLALPLAPLRLTTVSVPAAGHSFAAWRRVLPHALDVVSGDLVGPRAGAVPVRGARVRTSARPLGDLAAGG